MPTVHAASWHHTSLAVSDLDAAIAFYRAAFGYEVNFEEKGMSDQIARMTGIEGLTCDLAQLRSNLGEHVLELIAFHRPGGETPPLRDAPLRPGAAHIAFAVEDLDAALAAVEALGAARVGGVTEFDEGRSVYCREPSGSFFEMEEFRPSAVQGGGASGNASPHFSPAFVARAPRRRGDRAHGLRDAEGIADTMSRRLEGVRPVTTSGSASAAGGW